MPVGDVRPEDISDDDELEAGESKELIANAMNAASGGIPGIEHEKPEEVPPFGPDFTQPICFNCEKQCGEDSYCFGCKSFVCEDCDVSAASGGLMGPHAREEHLKEQDGLGPLE